MSKSIEAIEGIGPAYGARLRKIGCASPAALLRDGATPKGRQEIAAKSGISPSIILRCVNMADLFRVKGVASQYAELLEAAGVDTVKELRNRNAANLHAAMVATNAKKRLVRQVPREKMVADWIAQAKTLKPAVTY
jgi:predicted flap endonuclease-1-like 5' DNA nuclease